MVRVVRVQRPLPRPGFRAGFAAVWAGFGFLLRTPRSWPYAWVPAGVLTLLTVVLSWAAVWGARTLVASWLGDASTWYGRAAAGGLSWLGAIFGALIGLLLALMLTPPLSGPALEKIVGLAEQSLEIPSRRPLGFFTEIWCGARAQAVAALFAVPILALLWAVELAFAPAIFVTAPLGALVSALALAWNLFDYPLTLRGVRMRDRLRLVMHNKAAALGFGLAFAMLFWLPCLGVLLLPVGVAAATALVWRILDASPELLPELPRRVSADVSSNPPPEPAP